MFPLFSFNKSVYFTLMRSFLTFINTFRRKNAYSCPSKAVMSATTISKQHIRKNHNTAHAATTHSTPYYNIWYINL